jgi:hypothetical protein
VEKSSSIVIFSQTLLPHTEDACDEHICVFITLQWKLVITFVFEIPEKAQIKA